MKLTVLECLGANLTTAAHIQTWLKAAYRWRPTIPKIVNENQK